ncbi:MAG: ROK family protein [Anaerolineales bacterium]|jgi:glucokinase
MAKSADSYLIGIDVGATKIAAALVSNMGRVLDTRRWDTHAEEGAGRVIERMTRLANELIDLAMEKEDCPSPPLLGIGIGIPGQVNSMDGTVREAVNLGWGEVNLAAEMERGLIRETLLRIDTDTNASTLGEFHFGAARDCGEFAYISVGSGLGAGIFVDGHLVRGTTWKAAELGHISLDPEGQRCKCGQRGCVETIVSGPGLLKLVDESVRQGKYPSPLAGEKPISTIDVITAAREGDELAQTALAEMGCHLGIVIAICVSVINPALIVIGGGLGLAAFNFLVPAAKEELNRRVLPSLNTHLEILPSGLESSAIGAASLVL